MTAVRSLIEKKLAEKMPYILRNDINYCISIILENIVESVKNGSRCEIRGFGSIFSRTL